MDTLPQLIAACLDAFKPLGAVPILTPIGQQPGDLVDRLGEEFVCRRNDCFDGLAPVSSPGALPNIRLGHAAAARLAAGAAAIADAKLSASLGDEVVLRFDNVTVETIAQHAFRGAVRPDAPQAVKRLLNKDPDALNDSVLLIGTVFSAKQTLRAERHRQGGGGFSLPGLQQLAAWLGFNLRAQGGGELKNAEVIDLTSKQKLPVAFRPAFIRIEPGQPDTFRAITHKQDAPALRPFDPAQADHKAALAAWMDRQVARLNKPC